MTPSTPPRSRSTMEDQQPVNTDFFLSNMPKKQQMPPATPQKNTGSEIPMTPSTIMHRGHNDQQGKLLKADQPHLLAPPQLQKFNGFKSPEFSPMRRLSIPNNSLAKSFNSDKSNNTSNDNVSRVLFPLGLDSDDDNLEEESEDRLLPPSTPPPSKSAKITPGTPSHKIITSQQAKQWNNESHVLTLSSDEEDEESSPFITRKTMENPFMAESKPITKEERLQRHQKLIDENPGIENVVTYVNKRGETVKQRTLTPRQKDRFKPKALFQDDE